MKLFSLYRVEFRRLLLSRIVMTATVLCTLSLPLGNLLIVFSSSRPMSASYILTPVLTGTTAGAIVWAVVMFMEADRLQRSGVHTLTDAVAPPAFLSVARTLALMTLSAIVALLTALVYLPYTAVKMSYLFSADFYFANFMVFMLPTWWVSILFADAFYQITRRLELTCILYIALAGVSVSQIASRDYFMRWINPYVTTYSDGFPSIWPLRIGLYTRILWLGIALGVWLFSVLCIRRYQKGLIFSLYRNMKKMTILVPAVLFVTAGILLWKFQPFIDHGPDDYIYSDLAWDIDDANRISAIQYSLDPDPAAGTLSGKAEYDIQVPYRGKDTLHLNPGYTITKMTYDGENVPFQTVDDDTNGERTTYFELPERLFHKTLVIEYSGFPTQGNCWSGSMVRDTIDRDYISLSSVAIVPTLENYYTGVDKAAVAYITIPDNLTPFLNHELMKDSVDNGDGTRTWKAGCPKYISDLTAGYYTIDNFQIGDLEVDFAYGTAYEDIVRENDIQQTIIDILTYGSEHYGELFAADNNHLLMRQESAMFGGGYALHGVSTWFETVLAPDTLSDTDRGASATEVFIHEMLHQWWGGLGLSCAQEELWSSEGLTVYSTYRLVKEKYGELYARQYYVDAWKEAVDSQNRNFYNRHPEYLELLPELYQSQIQASNRSTNWYHRMPLMILKAEQLVGGEDKMDEILHQMYMAREDYNNENDFRYADFLRYCGLTEEDLYLE